VELHVSSVKELGLWLTALAARRLRTSLPNSCKRGCHPRGQRDCVRRCTACGSCCIGPILLRLCRPIDAISTFSFGNSRPVAPCSFTPLSSPLPRPARCGCRSILPDTHLLQCRPTSPRGDLHVVVGSAVPPQHHPAQAQDYCSLTVCAHKRLLRGRAGVLKDFEARRASGSRHNQTPKRINPTGRGCAAIPLYPYHTVPYHNVPSHTSLFVSRLHIPSLENS
jgi:hypothetical protein